MVKKKPRVVIENAAKQALAEAFQYISKDSAKNADKVKEKLLDSIRSLADNPHFNPPDKYRENNHDGAYRAYEIYKYRITYHVSAEQITIIRIRHTKMDPKPY